MQTAKFLQLIPRARLEQELGLNAWQEESSAALRPKNRGADLGYRPKINLLTSKLIIWLLR
jgi:hypothetical protein